MNVKDEMPSWQNDTQMEWQVDKMTQMEWQVDENESWWILNFIKMEFD